MGDVVDTASLLKVARQHRWTAEDLWNAANARWHAVDAAFRLRNGKLLEDGAVVTEADRELAAAVRDAARLALEVASAAETAALKIDCGIV
jgi:hypothetical protein